MVHIPHIRNLSLSGVHNTANPATTRQDGHSNRAA